MTGRSSSHRTAAHNGGVAGRRPVPCLAILELIVPVPVIAPAPVATRGPLPNGGLAPSNPRSPAASSASHLSDTRGGGGDVGPYLGGSLRASGGWSKRKRCDLGRACAWLETAPPIIELPSRGRRVVIWAVGCLDCPRSTARHGGVFLPKFGCWEERPRAIQQQRQ